MANEYIVRSYRSGDEEEIVKVLDLAFGGWPHFDLGCTSLDYWRWKHRDNPVAHARIIVAVCDDKIVGCEHGDLVKIKVGSKVLLCQVGEDLAIHPEHRGRGIYNKIEAFRDKQGLQEDINLTYWYTSNPIVIRNANKWKRPRFPYPIRDYIRIIDVDEYLRQSGTSKAWFKKYGYLFMKSSGKIESKFHHLEARTYKLSIEQIRAFGDGIDDFWDETGKYYTFIAERNKAYLNWRYCDPRGGNYVVKQAEDNGKTVGFIVLRINQYGPKYPIGYIIDLLTIPGRIEVANDLITDALCYFDEHKVNIVHCWAIKNHVYGSLLKRHGFVDARTDIHVFYNPRKLGSEIEEFKKSPAQNMHIQYGDIYMI